MEQFKKHAEDVFIVSLKDEMLEAYPDLFSGLPSALRRKMIENAVKRAENHNLTQKRATVIFIHLMAQTSPDFDKHPEVKAVLSQKDADEDEKADQLLALLKRPDILKELHHKGEITSWLRL